MTDFVDKGPFRLVLVFAFERAGLCANHESRPDVAKRDAFYGESRPDVVKRDAIYGESRTDVAHVRWQQF
jgi:hypothetical protein